MGISVCRCQPMMLLNIRACLGTQQVAASLGGDIVCCMGSIRGSLPGRADAQTFTVSRLVQWAQEGRIRVPDFQRALRWQTRDVLDFFDSIHRGLPIGSLLLWKSKAEAGPVSLGPLSVNAPAFAEAWWVVDGQQRLTSLAAGLLRPLPLPAYSKSQDPFSVYFDPAKEKFLAPGKEGLQEDSLVPLPALLDATRLSEWVHEWKLGKDRELRQKVFEAGTRIREYQVPLYLVETQDTDLLKEIFFRVNNTGHRLEWSEVYDALYGHDSRHPSTTGELSSSLGDLGMGEPSPQTITTCLLALRGLDVTRPLAEHRRKNPELLRNALRDALPVLKNVLSFLNRRASIPHLRLLPRTVVLEVLTRFFVIHPQPGERTLNLLVRWVWRTILGGETFDERTLERKAVAAVVADEEESLQSMLELVAAVEIPLRIPESFDARVAGSRLALLALAARSPLDLENGSPIDVAKLIKARDVAAFPPIVRERRPALLSNAPANRLIHPPRGNLKKMLLGAISKHGRHHPILRSHLVSPQAAIALQRGSVDEFLRLRQQEIASQLRQLGNQMAGWRRRDSDRPSIDFLLRKAGP